MFEFGTQAQCIEQTSLKIIGHSHYYCIYFGNTSVNCLLTQPSVEVESI
jgi:hypothetical protein